MRCNLTPILHPQITPLGRYLAALSLEPLLAKLVLMAVVMGCLDPVLLIACSSSARDPFLLPMNPAAKVCVCVCVCVCALNNL